MFKLLILLVSFLYSCVGYSLELNPDRTISLIGPVVPESLYLNDQMLQLQAEDANTPIDLVINSPGGYVSIGFRIITVMKHIKSQGTKIRCFVPGMAASMAFQILLHCSERHVLDLSQLLFHRVRVFIGGGFGGGTVLTGPDSLRLARDLSLADKMIIADLKEYLQAPMKWMMYHFNVETFHIGSNLCKKLPDVFTCHKSIEGLIPFVVEAEGNSSDHSKVKPKDGTLIYIAPGSK